MSIPCKPIAEAQIAGFFKIMHKVTINHKDIGETEYTIYTKDEADAADIDYKYWKNAEAGEYALSDDDYVAKIIKKKKYINYRKEDAYYIRFPFGYEMWNPKYTTKKLKMEGRKSAYTLTGIPKIDQQVRSERVKNLALCYAQVFDRDLAILLSMGEVSPDTQHKYRRIMKTERFRNMVSEEVKKQLADQGMDEVFTLKLFREVIELAKGKNDVTNLLRAIENLQEMHGMKGGKTKRSIAIEEHVTKRIIDDIDTEKRRIEMEQETSE